ncbi:FtsH protease activity modulator HflK [Undibacterium sp. TJN19]|uniref:FtsH protease activity modulator HflK n=1 Tax=Undibacterium sp. TJN19 TaxID=3413055 RepID=UPI003BF2C8E5
MLVSLLKRIGLAMSLNDPQWGRGSQNNNQNNNQDKKKPPEGPPDLDQLWKDFIQKLSRLFGQKGNGGDGNGGFTPDSNGAKVGASLIVAIFVLIWLASGFFIVQEGQTAVITTFGKFSHQTTAGFNWRWPYPIQGHEIVNVSQVRTVEVGYRSNVKNKQARESLMLTDDENIVDIQFAVQYKLNSAPDWLYNNRDQEDMIRQVAETAVREIVGKSKMDFVLYEGREKVAFDVSASMQKILDVYNAGVQIANVTMQGVQPPEQVQTAFDDAQKAKQDKERQKNEGQAYANEVIPKARGEASRMLQEAEAYQASIVANAEGNAARFKQVLAEYQKAPAVTRDRMYLETMQQIFANTSKLMMDTKTGNNMIYLPLDKLISPSDSGAAKAVAPVPAPVTTGSEQIPTVEMRYSKDGRSRDSRDSRDREVR